jgi:hypothetical protein
MGDEAEPEKLRPGVFSNGQAEDAQNPDWEAMKNVEGRSTRPKVPCFSVLHFVRHRWAVWRAASILTLQPESLYLSALAGIQQDAIRRAKSPKMRILSPLRLSGTSCATSTASSRASFVTRFCNLPVANWAFVRVYGKLLNYTVNPHL